MFTKAQIDHITSAGRARYEQLRDQAPDDYKRMYYDLCSRLQPEVSRWTMERMSEGADENDILNALAQAMCGSMIAVVANIAKHNHEYTLVLMSRMLVLMGENVERQLSSAEQLAAVKPVNG